MFKLRYALVFLFVPLPFTANAQGAPVTLKVYSAGSLKGAWTELARAYEAKTGNRLAFEFGASGLLRKRLEKGEQADLFTSADTGHPQALAGEGLAEPMQVFTANRLCAIAQPELGLSTANLLDKLLDPAVRIGTSTPKSDPSGDYTWAMFERAEKIRPGAFETLSKKAQQLVGGPNSPPPPKNRSASGKFMDERAVDVFITYCTGAVTVQHEVPRLLKVALPENLSVTAAYGMTVMRGAKAETAALAAFVLSPEGQKVLMDQGFVSLSR
jgi:molybdate transport system substrate-binding protein